MTYFSFAWNEEVITAFLTLKEALVTAHVLALPNYDEPLLLRQMQVEQVLLLS